MFPNRSTRPPDISIQRRALRAAADAERQTAIGRETNELFRP